MRESKPAEVEDAIGQLSQNAPKLIKQEVGELIQLARSCVQGISEVAREWVDAACAAKGIERGTPTSAEEITAGPVAAVRYLQLLIQTLQNIQQRGSPQLPGELRSLDGRLRIPVFPTRSLYDRLLFRGIEAETWLCPGVDVGQVFEPFSPAQKQPTVCVVLGAGNVSSIPATDATTKIFQDRNCVCLKMNPVNDYVGPLLERAFAPLITAGFLRIVYGGAQVGRQAIQHELIDAVHITGSDETHDAIVWGSDASERSSRKAENDPCFQKTITSELGNVSPWIVVPGRYSDRQLRFQAENIAASITNNASFNCIATKVIVTWKDWPDHERFLNMVEANLARIPTRKAYYPGAMERFEKFAGRPINNSDDHLPWTLLRDIHREESPEHFERESFVCVCVDSALEAASPDEFLARSVDFANEELWGTLAATLTVPGDMQRNGSRQLDGAIQRLRFGTIGVNVWPAIGFALMSPPWGGFAGSTLANVQSGIGFVHNTFYLHQPEKTILRAPLTMTPKPVWFPFHRDPVSVAWKLFDLYADPNLGKLPSLFYSALRG